MSLLENVKNLKFKDISNDLKVGKMPKGCEVIDVDGKKVDLMPFSIPRDKSGLSLKSGEKIATYYKCIDAWVLEKGLSPDLIPEIKGKPTISCEQYQCMETYAKYMNDTLYRWAAYEHSLSDGYQRSRYEINYGHADWSRQLSLKTKDLLRDISIKPEVKDVYEYSKTKGDNKHSNPQKTSVFRITDYDVMHCMFGSVKRIKEFENDYIDKNIENQFNKNIEYFAIGNKLITKQDLAEWQSYFKLGTTPKDMNVFEYYDFDDNRYTKEIPHSPINEVHSISYCGYPFAVFKDYGWQLCCTSNIEGIPPITDAEISTIYGCETRTDKKVIEQRKEIEATGVNVKLAKEIQQKQLEDAENTKRIQAERAKQLFAVGRNQVNLSQIDEWKEDFQRGLFPSGFSIFYYVDYEDNSYLESIPERPNQGLTIDYNGEPFAKFTGDSWELCAKSGIDGIPPITSDELNRIFTYSTTTSRSVKTQKDDIKFGTIDELIESTESNINTQNIPKEQENVLSSR